MTTINKAVTDESDGEGEERRARLRGRRIGLGVVMVVAVSAWARRPLRPGLPIRPRGNARWASVASCGPSIGR